MKPRTLLPFLFASALFAQEPAKPAAPAPALPAANSPEASKLVEQAIAKMAAYGRGTFKTTEAQDAAMMRNAGMPFGNDDTEVAGGWHREMLWGEHDGHEYVKANGRMLAKLDGAWRLRGTKIGGGKAAPFTLDPQLLFTLLQELPADARQVVHVEAGEAAGKPVTILSLELTGDAATEFVDGGAVPGCGAGGGIMMIRGIGGGMPEPKLDHTVNLALFVDASGDLVRFAAKVFEKNPMMANVQFRVARAGANGAEEVEEAEEKEEAKTDGPVEWKKGFPKRKPAKDESVATFTATFADLGRAETPKLGEREKVLLRLH